jgi:hypothetical protein
VTQHWYERDAEKDVSGRKHHILPGTVADLRKQMLNCVHRLPFVVSPLRDMRWKRAFVEGIGRAYKVRHAPES